VVNAIHSTLSRKTSQLLTLLAQLFGLWNVPALRGHISGREGTEPFSVIFVSLSIPWCVKAQTLISNTLESTNTIYREFIILSDSQKYSPAASADFGEFEAGATDTLSCFPPGGTFWMVSDSTR
jgi:hypothetical protein